MPPLLDTVLDQIGTDIVSGKIAPGEKFTLQTLCETFSISRTVARETMRALEHLGMVSSSRRVGITVLPAERWSVFSEPVIRWRLRVPSMRQEQLSSLATLRRAVVPSAGRIAAVVASQRDAQQLSDLASNLRAFNIEGMSAAEARYTTVQKYHALLLQASDNEMFSALIPSFAAVIESHYRAGEFPENAPNELISAYEDVAMAIFRRDEEAALKQTELLLELESVAVAI